MVCDQLVSYQVHPWKDSLWVTEQRKPKLIYPKAFECTCFVLNNEKDDLEKFDPESDEEIFIGYSSNDKAYDIFNKRT